VTGLMPGTAVRNNIYRRGDKSPDIITVSIVITVCNIKTAHKGIIITMPTVITLLPILCDISILYTSISYYRGPNRVVSSMSAP